VVLFEIGPPDLADANHPDQPLRVDNQLTKLNREVPVCTENRIRVDDVMESPKLAE
jgi:hypothetical protein